MTPLQFGVGTTGFDAGYGYRRWPLRSFPSSGGLQTPEIYVAVRDVSALEPGLYHYEDVDHALELLRPGPNDTLLATLGIGQTWIAAAPVVIVMTGYYARARWKYGAPAFRYMWMDVGFATENLCLVAESLRLGACAVAGSIDDPLERLLGVDWQAEVPMVMLTVGSVDAHVAGKGESESSAP